jgi:superfamily I DNA/RNA helicase
MESNTNKKELDYLFILRSLQEIPFNVGKKLLIDFLQGNEDNESIERNHLYEKENFGCLAYDKEELDSMLDSLLLNNLIQFTSVNNNKFWKVLELTQKGRDEIHNPQLYKKKLSFNFKETKTIITDKDRELFSAFGDFLSKFNDEQKKSIISNSQHILCIAGAGSGKTTVLTKRIEFLVKYKSIDQSKILAVTFTRKARQEMINRLSVTGHLSLVMVETFNSFCEKILRQHNDLVYRRSVRVISYRDKIMMIKNALTSLNISMQKALDTYFSFAQRRGKTNEQLANIFLNDCFFIRDYFKFKNRPISESSFDTVDSEHEQSAKIVFGICNYIEAYMKKQGLRDFADQLVDTIHLFENRKELIPKFDHVLIDEYQDVNSTQIKLVDLLSPKNLFCVGDPRQSIYGWRGSDIKHILHFEEKYSDCDIITLTKNYRSTKHIVGLINNSIRNMGLADLESSKEGSKDIKLLKFDSESAEFEFVIQRILSSKLSRKEIFVLARTNRQLNELSQSMKLRGIKHVVRSDEVRKTTLAGENDITLATIHAIKGMEAEMVFVIGSTINYFPCRGSEHPVIEMVKVDEYDKEEEERRLLYVAMSRSKNSLYLTYHGKKPTNFITGKMLEILEEKEVQPKLDPKFNLVKSNDVVTRLKDWRKSLSEQQNIPPYIIMHDRTVIDLAVKMPMTIADLDKVHGLGPAKIMKYGEDILRIVMGQ